MLHFSHKFIYPCSHDPETLTFHSEMRNKSKIEQLLELFDCVLGILNGVANGSRILVDFPVVTAGECLVAEEVDFLVLHARQSL